MDFDLNHPNTMIIVNNNAELAYILEWCMARRISFPVWIKDMVSYPIAISPNDGSWVFDMDRALYYVSFVQFITKASEAQCQPKE